jgi:L-iditol 2-dehydrogenase
MRAAVLHGREDVRLEEVEVPRPGPGEILLRHQVALTCGTDVKVYRRGYHARMIVPPAVFGHEVAGVVEEVGEGVAGLEPGTAVVPANSAPCGDCPPCRRGRPSLCDDLLFWNGAYAELGVIPARIVEKNLLRMPPGMAFRDAAIVEPLACVVRGVEESGIGPGLSVAVMGVGPIGQMFVALARRRGARVTAFGRHPGRLERARALGAEQVVKVEEGHDLVRALRSAGGDGQGPDVVVEAVGLPQTSEAAIEAVRKGGTVQLFGGCPAGARVSFDAQRLHYEELTIRATFHHTPASVREAFRLVSEGEIAPSDFITGEEPLERLPEILAEMARGGEGLKVAIRPTGGTG